MKDLSIVVISYNTKKITKKCIDTIIESLKYDTGINAEIIVVDNGSIDGSAEVIENIKSQILNIKNISIKLIKNNTNLGYAGANNLAVKKAEGKSLLFLNSDIEVIKDAIPKIYSFFINNENRFQFIGGKLLNKNMTPQPSCGSFYSLPVVFGALFLRGDYWGLTRWSPNEIKEVDWVSGACIITTKEFFNKVDGFDEKIFMYMDEIDLLYRTKKIGYRIGFYPEAKFIHLGSASSAGRTQPILQVYHGLLYFYKKHRSRLETNILKFMLKLKALAAVIIGKIFNNQYLTKTYGQAYQITKNFR
jgi:GT2 family glycosyltransferase